MQKGAGPLACAKHATKVWHCWVAKAQIIILLLLSIVLVRAYMLRILILDTTVFIAGVNYDYLFSWSLTCRQSKCQPSVSTTCEHPQMTFAFHFYHVSMHSTYSAYHTMLWPEFIVEGMGTELDPGICERGSWHEEIRSHLWIIAIPQNHGYIAAILTCNERNGLSREVCLN